LGVICAFCFYDDPEPPGSRASQLGETIDQRLVPRIDKRTAFLGALFPRLYVDGLLAIVKTVLLPKVSLSGIRIMHLV
jgi:hypothetical protein